MGVFWANRRAFFNHVFRLTCIRKYIELPVLTTTIKSIVLYLLSYFPLPYSSDDDDNDDYYDYSYYYPIVKDLVIRL